MKGPGTRMVKDHFWTGIIVAVIIGLVLLASSAWPSIVWTWEVMTRW